MFSIFHDIPMNAETRRERAASRKRSLPSSAELHDVRASRLLGICRKKKYCVVKWLRYIRSHIATR